MCYLCSEETSAYAIRAVFHLIFQDMREGLYYERNQ